MVKFSRIMAVILILAMIGSSPALAAEENVVQPRASAFISGTLAYLYDISGTTFGVWFEIIATGIMPEVGVNRIKIQRSTTGTSGWATVKTMYPEDYPEMFATGVMYYANSVSYTGKSGSYYRALVTFYAKNSTGIGEYSCYTDIMLV